MASEQDERLLRLKWDLNAKYPEYAGHLMFDGANDPIYNITMAKVHHKQLINDILNKKIDSTLLEIVHGRQFDIDLTPLFIRLKALKEKMFYDDSSWTKIEDLASHLALIKSA